MKIGEVVNQDFKSWKGKTSMVLSVLGCNMHCPFCNTPDLVKQQKPEKAWEKEFKRVKNTLNGVIITGGEPLTQNHISIFCKKLKLKGLKIRIETNGTKPDLLESLINKKIVDSVALDLKAPLEKYPEVTKSNVDTEKIKQSMNILRKSRIEYEIRTTWSPDLKQEDILETASQCPGTTWVLQQFIPGNCLNPEYNTKEKTPYELLKETAKKAEGPKEVRIKSEKGEEVI